MLWSVLVPTVPCAVGRANLTVQGCSWHRLHGWPRSITVPVEEDAEINTQEAWGASHPTTSPCLLCCLHGISPCQVQWTGGRVSEQLDSGSRWVKGVKGGVAMQPCCAESTRAWGSTQDAWGAGALPAWSRAWPCLVLAGQLGAGPGQRLWGHFQGGFGCWMRQWWRLAEWYPPAQQGLPPCRALSQAFWGFSHRRVNTPGSSEGKDEEVCCASAG